MAAVASARAAGPVLRASASVVKFPGYLAAYAAAHFRSGAARDAGDGAADGADGGGSADGVDGDGGADWADGGGEGGEGEGATLPALKVGSVQSRGRPWLWQGPCMCLPVLAAGSCAAGGATAPGSRASHKPGAIRPGARACRRASGWSCCARAQSSTSRGRRRASARPAWCARWRSGALGGRPRMRPRSACCRRGPKRGDHCCRSPPGGGSRRPRMRPAQRAAGAPALLPEPCWRVTDRSAVWGAPLLWRSNLGMSHSVARIPGRPPGCAAQRAEQKVNQVHCW